MCFDLVFLQGDLAHLSVAHKGTRDLVNRLSRSHSDDVVGRYEAGPVSDLPLVTQRRQPLKKTSYHSGKKSI